MPLGPHKPCGFTSTSHAFGCFPHPAGSGLAPNSFAKCSAAALRHARPQAAGSLSTMGSAMGGRGSPENLVAAAARGMRQAVALWKPRPHNNTFLGHILDSPALFYTRSVLKTPLIVDNSNSIYLCI